ncbi:MAG: Acyl-[acyl-carrier-protein]--UDP-N-acetylglucosamine O-acyltransferase [Phycisphaerae bacterium]|nr:Acyl-[acyl-carrier-protein]--UDP-N-acetylglucosamine O-acyltransferase [Phycisphaerae bacterium]
MMHPTAIVDSKAQIGVDVDIGAYAVVGPDVRIGDGCRIHHHATIEGHTVLGPRCQVYTGAVIGTPPQDRKYRGAPTRLDIGHDNIFREMVTVHPGTEAGGGVTSIGDHNLFLIGVHIAHDCRVGNRCIIANYTQLAGHVCLEDHVNMGGMSALHHFVTVGRHAFIGGMTRVVSDVPPFMIVVAARGTRPEIRMVNGVGLQRAGFAPEAVANLRKAFMQLYSRRARLSGVAIRDRVESMLAQNGADPNVEYLCKFLLRSFELGRHGRYLEALRTDRANSGAPAAR